MSQEEQTQDTETPSLGDLPLTSAEVEQTTALGAAYLAGVGVGLWSQDRVVSSWRARSRYEPTMSSDQRQSLLAAWHAAVHTARGHG